MKKLELLLLKSLLITATALTIFACTEKQEDTNGFVVKDYPDNYPAVRDNVNLDNDEYSELNFSVYGRYQVDRCVSGCERLGEMGCKLAILPEDAILTLRTCDIDESEWKSMLGFPQSQADKSGIIAVRKKMGTNTYSGWFTYKCYADDSLQHKNLHLLQSAMCTIPNQHIVIGQTHINNQNITGQPNPDIESLATSAADFLGTYKLILKNDETNEATLSILPLDDNSEKVQIIAHYRFLTDPAADILNTTATYNPQTHRLIPAPSDLYIEDRGISFSINYSPVTHHGDSLTFLAKFVHNGSQGSTSTIYQSYTAIKEQPPFRIRTVITLTD